MARIARLSRIVIRSGRRAATSEATSVTASISSVPTTTAGTLPKNAVPDPHASAPHGPSQTHSPALARL